MEGNAGLVPRSGSSRPDAVFGGLRGIGPWSEQGSRGSGKVSQRNLRPQKRPRGEKLSAGPGARAPCPSRPFFARLDPGSRPPNSAVPFRPRRSQQVRPCPPGDQARDEFPKGGQVRFGEGLRSCMGVQRHGSKVKRPTEDQWGRISAAEATCTRSPNGGFRRLRTAFESHPEASSPPQEGPNASLRSSRHRRDLAGSGGAAGRAKLQGGSRRTSRDSLPEFLRFPCNSPTLRREPGCADRRRRASPELF